jgi:hypothetical protein
MVQDWSACLPSDRPPPYLFSHMLRSFRSPGLAWLALVAFLAAQPLVACAFLCLDDHHAHGEMTGMAGASASGPVACHHDIGGATRHGPAQTLSAMEPAREPVSAPLAPGSVQASETRSTAPPETSLSLDPPPPRPV